MGSSKQTNNGRKFASKKSCVQVLKTTRAGTRTHSLTLTRNFPACKVCKLWNGRPSSVFDLSQGAAADELWRRLGLELGLCNRSCRDVLMQCSTQSSEVCLKDAVFRFKFVLFMQMGSVFCLFCLFCLLCLFCLGDRHGYRRTVCELAG